MAANLRFVRCFSFSVILVILNDADFWDPKICDTEIYGPGCSFHKDSRQLELFTSFSYVGFKSVVALVYKARTKNSFPSVTVRAFRFGIPYPFFKQQTR